jgi:hypothetical protein
MDDHDLRGQPAIVKSAMRVHVRVTSWSVILCAVAAPGGELPDETALLAVRTAWTICDGLLRPAGRTKEVRHQVADPAARDPQSCGHIIIWLG